MSYMHTYEYDCTCGAGLKMELHKKADKHPLCPACNKEKMDLVFYLRSPDTRAELAGIRE